MGRREPRVLGLTTVADGCALYRIWMPLAALEHAGWDTLTLREAELEPWHLEWADLAVLPRLGADPDRTLRLAEDARRAGCKLVYECDDDLWRVRPENPGYEALVAHGGALRGLLRVCAAATTTNAHLARRLQEEAGRKLPVHVLPNAVDPRVWATAGRGRTDRRVTVGVHGAWSHGRDWEPLGEAFSRLAETHPGVRLLCGGYTPPAMAAVPDLVSVPFQPLAAYPHLVAEIDVACCPLEDTDFNRAKSPIKWLESAMTGAAAVVSETVYGPAVRACGGDRVALVIPAARDRDPAAWSEALTRLLDDPPRRERMGRTAKAAVTERFGIGRRWKDWARAYRAIAGPAGPTDRGS
jgi:glycosyltransferase involved in cell wall biosynthesis